MKPILSVDLSNSFGSLPSDFFVKMNPEIMPDLKLIKLNEPLCKDLGLQPDQLKEKDGVNFLGGKNILSNQKPLAQAYAGHQFGNFVPQLGDGRAILLGELIGQDGGRRDLQLKGSGRTPFSRMGDGRSGLGPVLREYIVSEAMFALGIPTTRALAALFTGERVVREGPVPGAILVRIAKSHIRIGTFEYFAHRGEVDNVKILANYVIDRHYPEIKDKQDKYVQLLEKVIEKQALLIAEWMRVGFIHGVMNTDNMTLSGETIDFGPCAFMDSFNMDKSYSSIDAQGRYRFANQPHIATWNLSRLAETLLPLIDENQTNAVKQAEKSLDSFVPLFTAHWTKVMGGKLGIESPIESDKLLIENLLELMQSGYSDYTLTFRKFSKILMSNDNKDWLTLFQHPENPKLLIWLKQWENRLKSMPITKEQIAKNMNSINPYFIPRNHIIELCISEAVGGDLSRFYKLAQAIKTPYSEEPEFDDFSKPPENHEIVRQTFCGT